MVKANATVMGNIFIVDNPEAEGRDARPQEYKKCLVLQFESTDDIRKAIEDGKVEFTVFGG